MFLSLQSMIADLRSGLGCLLDKDAGAGVGSSLTRLESLLGERLGLTQRRMDSLETLFTSYGQFSAIV